MIIAVTQYKLECDICGTEFKRGHLYDDEDVPIIVAEDSGWLNEYGNHYCAKCHWRIPSKKKHDDEDNDA